MQRLKKSIFIFLVLGFLAACARDQMPDHGKVAKRQSQSHRSNTGGPDYEKAALANVELGLGYLAQGQVVRAKAKLTHALQLAPHLAEGYSAMGYFWEMTGEIKDAEKYHKKAIRLATQAGDVYNSYGTFLCRRSRFAEAEQAVERALIDKTYP